MCLANTVPQIASESLQDRLVRLKLKLQSTQCEAGFPTVMSNSTIPQMREGMPARFSVPLLPFLANWIRFLASVLWASTGRENQPQRKVSKLIQEPQMALNTAEGSGSREESERIEELPVNT